MITIIYNPKASIAPQALAIIEQIKAAQIEHTTAKPTKDTRLIIALGGDGTFIRAAHAAKENNIPILAVGLGRLGFLAEIKQDIISALAQFEANTHYIDSRTMLDVTICDQHGKPIHKDSVLNEAVILRNGIARLFEITIHPEQTLRADGLIISTPTGSTAYNMAAQGTIITPHTPSYLLTPLCPQKREWTSQQINEDETTVITAQSKHDQNIVVVYDGYGHYNLPKNYTLQITKSAHHADFVRFKPYDFEELVQTKL